MTLIIHRFGDSQKILLHFSDSAIRRFGDSAIISAKSSAPCPAYFFHQGALTGAHKLTRPRLVTASTGPLALLTRPMPRIRPG
jgi:hypothetical protein